MKILTFPIFLFILGISLATTVINENNESILLNSSSLNISTPQHETPKETLSFIGSSLYFAPTLYTASLENHALKKMTGI